MIYYRTILALYEIPQNTPPLEVTRIRSLWQSLPSLLSKENRKFIYKVIRTGARAKDYKDAQRWLKDAGMIYQVFNVSKPGTPLKGYAENERSRSTPATAGSSESSQESGRKS